MAAALFCKRLWPRPSICCSSLRHYGRRRKGSTIAWMSYSGSHAFGDDGLGSPTVSDCNGYLKDLLKPSYGSPRLAKQFLAQMLILGAIPDISTFSIIIKSYCQYHKYHDVLDLVSKQMKASEVKANASFCKTFVLAACACYKPYACHFLFQRLRSSYEGQLPLACYNAIVNKLCPRKGTNDGIIKDGATLMVLLHELSKMKQLGVYPDKKIYHMLLHARSIPLSSDNFQDCEKIGKALMMGSLLFTQGIRIGAVNPGTA